MKKLVVTTIALSLFASTALAHGGKRAKHRQHKQRDRIQQGVNSGELNRREARRLRKEQKEIRENRKEAMADGKMDKKERKELRKQQREASKNIYRQKHDKQKRKSASQ